MRNNLSQLRKILGLSFYLARANFKLRNEGSYLGILWYLLDPLLMFLIILLIRINIVSSTIEYYPIYLLIGLIVFNFFRGAGSLSVHAIKGNANFIKSMNIAYEPLVISVVMQSALSHFFEVIVLVIFLIVFGVPLIGILLYPIVFILLAIFVQGVSYLLAAIGVYIVDVSNVWSVVARVLWFLTPIFYVVLPGSKIYFLNLFNPMFYFIEFSRELIIYRSWPNLTIVAGAVLSSVIFFALGLWVFKKSKHNFAEQL